MLESSKRLLETIQNSVSFRNKIFIFILVSMGLQLTFIGVNFRGALLETLQHQVGTRALVQAQEIATDPALIVSVEKQNRTEIEQLIQRIGQVSDANSIVIANRNGAGLSLLAESEVTLSKEVVSELIESKQAKISFEDSSNGYAITGKTVVTDASGRVIGFVSVGYLVDRFDEWMLRYAQPLVADFFIILLITLVVGWLFSSHIKRNMNGKEPAEIALAYNMRKSILQSVYEGVIAVDKQGSILSINNTARELVGTELSAKELNGQSITEYINQSQFLFYTPYEENLRDEQVKVNDNILIANRVAIYDQQVLTGWVFSFRKKEELSQLTEELAQIRQYTDNLRAMRDEYENKISTISGLLEMGDSNAALELIYSEKHRKQETREFIKSRIHSKRVAGILIGKASKARVLGLDLQFDKETQLSSIGNKIDISELSTVVGNLLDNAFEATLKNPDSSKVVSLLISDSSGELVIEVKDNGCGINPDLAMTMFSRGVSGHEDEGKKGVGLYLIGKFVYNAGGVIMVDEVAPKGTVFSLFIPI
ncbi:ATP-binding protein [Vibrio sp. SCSIO 43137]|uniref:ATP-binding protein n=1 Tax=Vibrio sp. SCSIO 43137 TaxID=3021011 RepID=UPI0023082F55|nr:sensor histidine kinase [Vibrio sp. SCSIO 43137]WCE31483.1 sensor histidine kinase [Vibrio sp. SCSIO 43137]